MRKSRTYFEQVPVELVKKIAEEDLADKKGTGNNGASARIPAGKAGPYSMTSLRKNGKSIQA